MSESANPFAAPAAAGSSEPAGTPDVGFSTGDGDADTSSQGPPGTTGGPTGAMGDDAAADSAPAGNAQGSVGANALDADFFSQPAADSFAPPGSAAEQTAPAEDGKEDARVAWRRDNEKLLAEREAEEKKANDEVRATAADWLQKFNDEREERIAKTKKENLAQESAKQKGPTGDTDWAKVNSMVDFTFKPPQEREAERERFKQLLFRAKDKNVPVKM